MNELNEHLMLPWDAGDKMLFRILQDELGTNLEQKPLVFYGKFRGCFYLIYDMIFFSRSCT